MTLGCAAASAHAEDWLHFEGSLGATDYVAGGNGLYYQEGLEHHLDLRVPAGRIGVDADVIEPHGYVPGLSVNLSYMYFGQASIGGDAAPDPSGQFSQAGGYNTTTNTCNGPCGPIRNFATGGSLQALALTLEPYWTAGSWRFGIEGGAALFRGTWTAKMTVVSPSSPWGPEGTVQSLSHDPKPQLTWVAGASVAYKRVTLRYTYISTPSRNVSDSNIPLGFKSANMLTLGYRF